jgi:hypothetical protein
MTEYQSQFATGMVIPCPATIAYPQGIDVPFDTVRQISCYREIGHSGQHEGSIGHADILVWGLDEAYAESADGPID